MLNKIIKESLSKHKIKFRRLTENEMLNEAKPDVKALRRLVKELDAQEKEMVNKVAELLRGVMVQEARYQFFSTQADQEEAGITYDEFMNDSLDDDAFENYMDSFASRVKRKFKSLKK